MAGSGADAEDRLTFHDRVVVDRDFHRPIELASRLTEFDFMISTRMHVAILALGVGVPVFPIAYEFKTGLLFRQLGFPDRIPDINDISRGDLLKSFEQFLIELPRHRRKVFTNVLELKCQADDLAASCAGLFPKLVTSRVAGAV